MKFKETIGIDVSKLTIDVVIHSSGRHKQFKNTKEAYSDMIAWVKKYIKESIKETIIAFEHTGLYSLPLAAFLNENEINYTMIPGLELKKSLGIARGKNDKVDAKAIALYAYRRRDEIKPYQLPSKLLLEIRQLLSLRDKLVVQCSGFKVTNGETSAFLTKSEHLAYFEVQDKMIEFINEQIIKVETRLKELIANDEKLATMHKLIASIKGIGDVTAWYMIAFTNGFTLFENARKFASYAGVAPFPNQSGTSLRGKTKVSHLANLKFKSLLSNCAASAIKNNAEMRIYYNRRIKEGKDKMSTINIIKNKLLGRIFAVVKRGTEYTDTMKFAS